MSFNRFKRAVSPVIAAILLIALTVATVAIVYGIINGFTGASNVELVIEQAAVADTDANGAGDLISLKVRNLGSSDAEITDVTLLRDDVDMDSWVVKGDSYTIPAAQIGYVEIITATSSQEVVSTHDIEITLTGEGIVVSGDVTVPNVLSSLPVFYENTDFSSIDIVSAGWVTHSYHDHGGSSSVSVDNGDILLNTNHDLIFYLANDSYKVKNGIITLEFEYGDNDGVGIAFRIVDELNYYWIGFTNDHNAAGDDCGGCDPVDYDGPTYVLPYRFELHKLVNGVDTLLTHGTPSFSIPDGSSTNLRGPYEFVISFSDDSFAFQAAPLGDTLEEVLSYTGDTSFTEAGYFGAISIAAQNTRFNGFKVTS